MAGSDPRLRAIGVSWFREEDYAAIRRISEDGHKMPSKWEDWLKAAEKMEKEALQSGKVVERITSILTHSLTGAVPMGSGSIARVATSSLP
jgi:hypothetical protein